MLDGLKAAGRQGGSLTHVGHRSWELPSGRWMMGQTWEDQLFAHWRVPVERIRDYVPAGLEIEEYEGTGWVGITSFRATALRARGTLPMPRLSSYLELNVRTYVRAADGKTGVWFFSLDASSRLAVEAARRIYRLPFFHARMTLEPTGEWIDVDCARLGERGKVFSGRYRSAGDVVEAEPGSLEWFLTERYCLYASDRHDALYRAEIHHELWPLQPAEAEIRLTSIAPFELHGDALCHVARRQDAVIWPLQRLPTRV